MSHSHRMTVIRQGAETRCFTTTNVRNKISLCPLSRVYYLQNIHVIAMFSHIYFTSISLFYRNRFNLSKIATNECIVFHIAHVHHDIRSADLSDNCSSIAELPISTLPLRLPPAMLDDILLLCFRL